MSLPKTTLPGCVDCRAHAFGKELGRKSSPKLERQTAILFFFELKTGGGPAMDDPELGTCGLKTGGGPTMDGPELDTCWSVFLRLLNS